MRVQSAALNSKAAQCATYSQAGDRLDAGTAIRVIGRHACVCQAETRSKSVALVRV